jgi:hypothetical protein
MVILNDPSHTEYSAIDLKLLKAIALKDQFMAGGAYPIWIDRSDRVIFHAKSFTSGSQAAIQRAQYNDEKRQSDGKGAPAFGKNWYAVAESRDGGPLPTMVEWLEEEAERRNQKSERPE